MKEHTREPEELLPVDEVLYPDLDLLQLIEDVELGEVQDIISIDTVRVTEHDEVEPATTATTACRRPVFAPYFLEVRANVLFLFLFSFYIFSKRKGTGRRKDARSAAR